MQHLHVLDRFAKDGYLQTQLALLLLCCCNKIKCNYFSSPCILKKQLNVKENNFFAAFNTDLE